MWSGVLSVSIFSQLNFISGQPPLVFVGSCIVLSSRIYIGVAQNIRYEVDVPGFPVEVGAVSASQFVRRDRFDRIDDGSVLFDQVLDGTYAHPL